jgi:NAD(P)-dependent dehydrogenase (short-subunit alcohol dehydrogenase family)
MKARLDGRVALVTGSARGIGRATAECLHADGATVLVSDLAPEDDPHIRSLLAGLPGAHYFQLDVTNPDSWPAVRDRIEQAFGRLDVLVNNVGAEMSGPVQGIDYADWRRIMAINVDSVFLGVKALQSLLAKTGATTPYGASIVNLSSIMGLVAVANSSSYNTAKGAVRLFTKSIAIEFAEAGIPIRANSIHPGFVDTEMLRGGVAALAAKLPDMTARQLVDAFEAGIPFRRLAQPVEIAKAIAFLASDDSSYMTGSELVVDGGWTAR